MIRFKYVPAPLPNLMLSCSAVYDLASTMREIYKLTGGMGSMTILTSRSVNVYRGDKTVEQWVLARFCDLPSIDRVLHLAGITEDVPRPSNSLLLETAAELDKMDRSSFPLNSLPAVDNAAALFWRMSDIVQLISTHPLALGDDIEAKAFRSAASREFANPEIQGLALKMSALLSSHAADAPLVSTFTKWTFPDLITDASWREWLAARRHDLSWIEECCALDGFNGNVPVSGPMVNADTGGAARKRQQVYEEMGGKFRSSAAAAHFALIRSVTELISTLLPKAGDI